MVVRRATRYVVQQLASRYGQRIQAGVKQEYGQIAGSIVGIGLSYFAGGDYFGEIRKSLTGNGSSDDRAPPFGYYDGSGDNVNGQTYGAFHQTLRATQYRNGRSRFKALLSTSLIRPCVV